MKNKKLPGENRRITKAMVQWAKEQGACSSQLARLKPGMTFRKYFLRRCNRQAFVLKRLYRSNQSATAKWRSEPPYSDAEFQEFLRLTDDWTIV